MVLISKEFITNSSSSSFTMIGVYIKSSWLNEKHLKKVQEAEPDAEITMDDLENFLYDYIEILIEGTGLSYDQAPYDDLVLGLPYTQMKDEETLRQFKDRIKKCLHDIFDCDIEPAHISACWEDR